MGALARHPVCFCGPTLPDGNSPNHRAMAGAFPCHGAGSNDLHHRSGCSAESFVFLPSRFARRAGRPGPAGTPTPEVTHGKKPVLAKTSCMGLTSQLMSEPVQLTILMP